MIEFLSFMDKLHDRLQQPLPGLESQLRMSTMRRIIRNGHMEVPPDARKAGVLALFYPHEGKTHIAFIKRNEYPGVHSGQISFPGGSMEKMDHDLTDTALRETEEEIGVDRNLVTPIGRLTDLFIPPSNFVVTPVVGYISERPVFRPDPAEVQRVIEVRLDDILDPSVIQEKEISIFPDVMIKVPCFYVENEVIWGATAMMLCELVDVISQGS